MYNYEDFREKTITFYREVVQKGVLYQNQRQNNEESEFKPTFGLQATQGKCETIFAKREKFF